MHKSNISSHKTRVTLSLDNTLVDELDQLAASQRISRSQCVQNLLRAYLETEKTVVVLAGGPSNSLFFDDRFQLRPLVELAPGYTLIEDILNKCRDAGFEKGVVIGEKEVITALMGVVGDGSRLGISIHYEIERESKGTAYTLARAKKYVRGDFLVVPCDTFFDFDLADLYTFHKKQVTAVSLTVYARLVPKPDTGPLQIGTLICMCNDAIFSRIPTGDSPLNLQEDIFPSLLAEHQLLVYPIAGSWVNIHDSEDLEVVKSLYQNSRSGTLLRK